MPIYEYRCRNGHTFEVFQSMADDPVDHLRGLRRRRSSASFTRSPCTSRARASTPPTTRRRAPRRRRGDGGSKSESKGEGESKSESKSRTRAEKAAKTAGSRTDVGGVRSSKRRERGRMELEPGLAVAPAQAAGGQVGLARRRRRRGASSAARSHSSGETTRLPGAGRARWLEHVGVRRRRSPPRARAGASSARPCRDHRLRRVPADQRALDEVDRQRA